MFFFAFIVLIRLGLAEWLHKFKKNLVRTNHGKEVDSLPPFAINANKNRTSSHHWEGWIVDIIVPKPRLNAIRTCIKLRLSFNGINRPQHTWYARRVSVTYHHNEAEISRCRCCCSCRWRPIYRQQRRTASASISRLPAHWPPTDRRSSARHAIATVAVSPTVSLSSVRRRQIDASLATCGSADRRTDLAVTRRLLLEH